MSTHHDLKPHEDADALHSPRRKRILAAAAHAFASTGYRGAGLRDIAADADVSLTLVTHYFGSKSELLHAVIDDHHEICRQRMVELSNLVIGDDGPIPLRVLVTSWVRYEYDLYTSPEGEHYLLLMLKLANETEVDEGVKRRLNCSEAVVLRGFERAAPASSRAMCKKAFASASAALQAGILDAGAAVDEGVPGANGAAIAFSTDFIVAGLEKTLA